MRHKIITLLLAVVVIIILVNIGGGGGSSSSKTASSKSRNPRKNCITSVTLLRLRKLKLLLRKWKKRFSRLSICREKATDGGVIVAVQYTVKNVSNKPLSSFSIPRAKLVDSKGTSYDSDIDASSSYATETKVDNSKILSDLNPNIKVTDVKAFEVDKNAYSKGTWKLKFSNDVEVKIK